MKKEAWFGISIMALVVIGVVVIMPPFAQWTNGHLGLLMLAMIVIAIMLGFPTAFTLMGMGTIFAFFAYYSQSPNTAAAHTFDLVAQRAYAVMNNDVLISVPLFVFMGYLVERANLIGRLFKSLHLATSRIPGSLAVATIITCAIFATATGIIGAVVTLMGLLAFPAMLKAGYSIRLSAGVVCAGGTLGILIPPSVLLILYGATAGVSVVQLYAGAFLPGIMLTTLYLGYMIISAKLKPSIAPPLSAEEQRVILPKFAEVISKKSNNVMVGLIGAIKGKRNADVPMKTLLQHLIIAILPLAAAASLVLVVYLWTTAPSLVDTAGLTEMGAEAQSTMGASTETGSLQKPEAGGLQEPEVEGGLQEPPGTEGGLQEPPAEPGPTAQVAPAAPEAPQPPAAVTPAVPVTPAPTAPGRNPPPLVFWITFGIVAVATVIFYAIFTFARLEIFKMLLGSFFPLAMIILGVLGSIVVGLATPTEAAAMGSFGGVCPGGRVQTAQFRRGEGVGLPHSQDLGHGLLALRRIEHLLGGLCPPGRSGDHQRLGEVDEHDTDPVHAPGPGDHLPPGLAPGVDRDHCHLHADLHPAFGELQHRSALFRFARGPESPDGVPLAAGGDGRLLPEGGGATPCYAQPDLHRDAAVHGDPDSGDLSALHVPADRSVDSVAGL